MRFASLALALALVAPALRGQAPQVHVTVLDRSLAAHTVRADMRPDEDAYLFAFTVDADNRALVLYPETPSASGFVPRGTRMDLAPFDRGNGRTPVGYSGPSPVQGAVIVLSSSSPFPALYRLARPDGVWDEDLLTRLTAHDDLSSAASVVANFIGAVQGAYRVAADRYLWNTGTNGLFYPGYGQGYDAYRCETALLPFGYDSWSGPRYTPNGYLWALSGYGRCGEPYWVLVPGYVAHGTTPPPPPPAVQSPLRPREPSDHRPSVPNTPEPPRPVPVEQPVFIWHPEAHRTEPRHETPTVDQPAIGVRRAEPRAEASRPAREAPPRETPRPEPVRETPRPQPSREAPRPEPVREAPRPEPARAAPQPAHIERRPTAAPPGR